jgi:hypothetical protein
VTGPYLGTPAAPTPPPWRELDRQSLFAFLLGLTWVGAPIAVLLGILGVRRTADGTRAGRWAAVSGIILGVVGCVGLVAAIAGTVWVRDNIKGVGRVEVGDCIWVDDADGVSFAVSGCSEGHRGEVVAAGELDLRGRRTYESTTAAEFCSREMEEPYLSAARSGRYLVTVVVDAVDPDEPVVGDAFACYFERADGAELSAPIGSEEDGNA